MNGQRHGRLKAGKTKQEKTDPNEKREIPMAVSPKIRQYRHLIHGVPAVLVFIL